MAESSVRLVPESTGPRVRTARLNIGGVDVDAQVVVLGDPSGAQLALLHASGLVQLGQAVLASNNAILLLDSLAQTLNYNTDGTLNYVQVVQGGSTYRQTFTYTAGKLTGVSAWVLQ